MAVEDVVKVLELQGYPWSMLDNDDEYMDFVGEQLLQAGRLEANCGRLYYSLSSNGHGSLSHRHNNRGPECSTVGRRCLPEQAR